MADFALEELKYIIKSFSPTQCDFLSENCIVALEENKHTSGCVLSVTGEETRKFKLCWNKEFNRSGYKERKKVTEKAAEAISFFLTRQLTDYFVIEEALIGTGIDYWLGYEASHPLYDPTNFIRARIEISGIDRETANNSQKGREKKKREQTFPSDPAGLPVYISVVEFSTPKASFARK